MVEAMVEIQQEDKRIVNRNLELGIVVKVTILEMVEDSIPEDNSILKRTSPTRGLISLNGYQSLWRRARKRFGLTH